MAVLDLVLSWGLIILIALVIALGVYYWKKNSAKIKLYTVITFVIVLALEVGYIIFTTSIGGI